MLYVWIGFLKPDAGPVPQEVQLQITEFLSPPYIKIRSVGPLHHRDGRRAGMMMLFEVPDRPAAEAFVANSPYLQAGLYERHDLYEYHTEVGGL
jgi:uncharacterized protein YciI